MKRLLLVMLLLTPACQRTEAVGSTPKPTVQILHAPEANLTDACVANPNPDIDYFPEKIATQYARVFRVSYHRTFKVVEIESDVGGGEHSQYVLVQCGTAPPAGYADAHVIQVPVMRFATSQSPPSQFRALDEMGVVDRLVGVNNFKEIMEPAVLQRIKDGQVHEIGSGTHSSIEMAMALDPELIFTFYSANPDANMHPKLWEVGVKAIPVADHTESDPLARAEWLKFTALFFNREHEAEKMFSGIAERYLALKKMASHVSSRLEVLLGAPNGRGIWGLNGGRNYLARAVEDAGGTYVWNSDFTSTIEDADYERIFDLSGDASFWFATSGAITAANRRALIASDFRMQFFSPVARSGLYGNDAGRLPSGAIPFTNESLSTPDVLLADLIGILHPELLPSRQLVYLRKVD